MVYKTLKSIFVKALAHIKKNKRLCYHKECNNECCVFLFNVPVAFGPIQLCAASYLHYVLTLSLHGYKFL